MTLLSRLTPTFVRYVAVQLLCYGVDLGIFILVLEHVHASPAVANVASKLAAGLVGFSLHRLFTFRATGQEDIARQAFKYTVLLLLNIPLTSIVLVGLLHIIPGPAYAKIVSDVICVGISFLLTRHVVFRRRVAGGV